MADTANSNVTPISADSNLTDQEKRDQLRARIEAGEKRNQQRSFMDEAKDVADNALEFAKTHPVATIAGGIFIGLAIGAMTRPGRDLRRRGGRWANVAGEAAMAYALSKIDTISDRMEDFGDTAETQARKLRRDASYRLDTAGDALRSTRRKAERTSKRALRDLGVNAKR